MEWLSYLIHDGEFMIRFIFAIFYVAMICLMFFWEDIKPDRW